MSIESKIELTVRIERRISRLVNCFNKDLIMDAIKDELCNYLIIKQSSENVDFNEDFLDSYLSAKTIEGRSRKTIERYRYALKKMIIAVNASERDITVYHLRAWLINERQRGVSDSTLEGYRSIFSAYFNWLQRESLIANNPCSNLGPIRCPKVVRLPFSDTEIEQLKEACGNTRDKAIICFLLSSGCRISEVVALNKDDVDLQNLQCKVHGKGNKERIAYLDNVTRMNLRKYEISRSDASEALFSGKGSSRLTPSGVRAMLNKLGKKACVENVHPHRFRRTLATNLINRGMPIQEVARILGHDKIDTTLKYVYINDKDIQMSYRKYS